MGDPFQLLHISRRFPTHFTNKNTPFLRACRHIVSFLTTWANSTLIIRRVGPKTSSSLFGRTFRFVVASVDGLRFHGAFPLVRSHFFRSFSCGWARLPAPLKSTSRRSICLCSDGQGMCVIDFARAAVEGASDLAAIDVWRKSVYLYFYER